MGQYYRILLCNDEGTDKTVFSSYDFDGNGAKLMEHSYYHNRFVEAALAMLAPNWRRDKIPLRVWWMGDYAEDDDIPEEKKKYDPVKSAWDDSVTPKVINESFDFSKPCYLVNESTREYIDLLRLEEINRGTWGGSIHPLPLLTAVGNGRGGGDYHGSRAINQRMVGAWAGDLLTIEESVPTSEDGFFEYIDITDDAHFSED